MSTAFYKIVSAVIAVLAVQPAVCKRIYRDRAEAIPEQDPEAISVEWAPDAGEKTTIRGGPTDHRTLIYVDCFARSSTESGLVAVDPLVERVSDRLYEDPTLGGLIGDLEYLGSDPKNDSDGMKTGWVRMAFMAEHRTTKSFVS